MKIKPIPFAPGYFVREDGVVYSERSGKRRALKVRAANGYKKHALRVGSKSVQRYVHRLVAHVFLRPGRPSQKHVRHLDGNMYNNHYKNLAWGTPSENAADRARHHPRARGYSSARTAGKKSAPFLFFLTVSEKKTSQRAAHEAGVSLGEYARRAIAFAVANPHIVKV